MTLRLARALTIGLIGTGLCLVPLSIASADSGPGMDHEQMMKMMTEMQNQMREMQGRMQGMGGMHGQMGRMMGQMGQMRGMMEQHHGQMMRHCPAGAPTPSVPSK